MSKLRNVPGIPEPARGKTHRRNDRLELPFSRTPRPSPSFIGRITETTHEPGKLRFSQWINEILSGVNGTLAVAPIDPGRSPCDFLSWKLRVQVDGTSLDKPWSMDSWKRAGKCLIRNCWLIWFSKDNYPLSDASSIRQNSLLHAELHPQHVKAPRTRIFTTPNKINKLFGTRQANVHTSRAFALLWIFHRLPWHISARLNPFPLHTEDLPSN